MSALLDALVLLRAAVDGVLALGDVSDGEAALHDFVVGVQREQHRLVVAAAPAVRSWERSGVWGLDGSLSAASRLAVDSRTSRSTARRVLRRARCLQEMPVTAVAVANGVLSTDHVDLFARANRPHRRTRFAEDEPTLVAACTPLLWDDAVRAVDYWCSRADADGAGDDDRQRDADRRAGAHLHASSTLDGTVVVSGVLDPVGGEVFLNELDRLEHHFYLTDLKSGSGRTGAQRRAAALVEMATRSATAPADGRRPKPLFVAHVGDETVRHLCELARGTVVAPGDLAGWIDDAVIESVLFDGPSTVLSVSQQRSFTGKLRRAIEARDRRCQHPAGCAVPAPKCDIDHITPSSQGGTTSQFNGRVECTSHNRHRNKHDHGATPFREQRVDRLETFRARIRWALLRHHERADPDN